jgi:hypothetical protein
MYAWLLPYSHIINVTHTLKPIIGSYLTFILYNFKLISICALLDKETKERMNLATWYEFSI